MCGETSVVICSTVEEVFSFDWTMRKTILVFAHLKSNMVTHPQFQFQLDRHGY